MSSRNTLVSGGKAQQLYLEKLSKEIKEYTVAIQQRPDDEVAYYNRGVCFFELQRFRQAVLDFTKSVSLRPTYEVAYFNRAVCYGKMSKYALAINDFTRVISFNPKFDMAFYNRGFYFEEWKHYEKAIQDYSRAIAINPKLSKAFVRRGLCYEEFGHQYDMAIENYTQALMINKNDSFAHFNRGLCYFHIYQFQSAINDYTRSIALKPDDDKAFYNRGECYKKMNQLNEAISDFSRFITLCPTSGDGYFKRGACYRSLGQLEKAISDFTVGTKRKAHFEAAYNQRGLCYQALGRPNEAFQDFSQAVKMNPFFANAWLNRGKLRWRSFAEYEKAIDDMERALVSNPKLRNAQTELNRLCKEILQIGKERRNRQSNRLSFGLGDADEFHMDGVGEEEEVEGEENALEEEKKKKRDGLLERPEELSYLRGLAFLKQGMVIEGIWSFANSDKTRIGYRSRKECRQMLSNFKFSVDTFKKEIFELRKECELIRKSRDDYFSLRKYHYVFPSISFLVDLQALNRKHVRRDERNVRKTNWSKTDRENVFRDIIPRCALLHQKLRRRNVTSQQKFDFENFQKLPASINLGQKDVRKVKIEYNQQTRDMFVWRIPFIQICRNMRKSFELFDHIALNLTPLDHRGVLRTYGGFKDEEARKNQLGYLVTECCSSTLGAYIQENKNTFNLREDIQVLLHLSSAMQYLHTHRIINREIKLEDILMKKTSIKNRKESTHTETSTKNSSNKKSEQRSSICKISTVNFAKQFDTEEDNILSLLYDSQGFAAPEILSEGFFPLQGEEVNPMMRKVGIYNFGMIMYCVVFKLTQDEFSRDLISMIEQIENDEKKLKLYRAYRHPMEELPYVIRFYIQQLYRHRVRNFFRMFLEMIVCTGPQKMNGKELTAKLTAWCELEMKIKSERKTRLKIVLDEFKRLVIAKSALTKIRQGKKPEYAKNRLRAFKAVFKREWHLYVDQLEERLGAVWQRDKVKLDQILYELNHCVHDCSPEIIKLVRKRFTYYYKNNNERILMNYPKVLIQLIKKCWVNDPEMRPNIDEIRRVLMDISERKN